MSQNPADTDRFGRLSEAEQPDGRIVIYDGDVATATKSGRWIVGEPVQVTR